MLEDICPVEGCLSPLMRAPGSEKAVCVQPACAYPAPAPAAGGPRLAQWDCNARTAQLGPLSAAARAPAPAADDDEDDLDEYLEGYSPAAAPDDDDDLDEHMEGYRLPRRTSPRNIRASAAAGGKSRAHTSR